MKCQFCGCTDTNACPGGCYWQAPEICSQCKDRGRERPILFSGPMVRAILAGGKTQTRRAVKPQPKAIHAVHGDASLTTERIFRSGDGRIHCPYGQPGDRLWVRETWFREPHPSELGLKYEDMPHTWAFACEKAGTYRYRADPCSEIVIDGRQWRPSIHMPRAACRLVLEVTDVRVQRLQALSEADACAEGVGSPITRDCKVPKFAALWESINGAGTWDEDPWVWAITFQRVTP